MAFTTGASPLSRISPIAAALAPRARAPRSKANPTQVTPGEGPRTETLFARLNFKLAELRGRGLRPQWMEMSQAEMVTLFQDAGEEVIRLDPDPSVDKAWYGDVEVRATNNTCIWIWVEGEVAGELSVHIID
jgi:hypothetical protein